MFKKYFFAGLAAGLLSGFAAFFYYNIYTATVNVVYPHIVTPASIFSACIFAGMLIALFCFTTNMLFNKEMEKLNSLLIVGGTMISTGIPFIIGLPLDIERPDLFPGLVVPMQLLPALAWFAIRKFTSKN
jgi:hypothetical protein